ncbi:ATP-binding protein [Tabrizicola sp. YIM 78059]|uniref:ATP-binding protein n=1 Tax=Tabrizicola sp. YIM 78059 TaxID=2529861 RepID=UPI0010AA18E0|nr:ATP-binding protein [Tabrizicola sp. YIM 78059]
MTDQTPDEDFLPLPPDFLREHFPVAPSLRRENREVFAAFLNADRLKDDAAFYAALARMVTCEEGVEALRTYDRRMKAKGDDKKAFALRALRWLCNQNPGLDPSAILKRDPEELPPLSEERAVQALFLRLAAPAGAKANDKDASPDGAAPRVALSEPDWRTLARALAATAAALDHPDATAAERILAMAEQLAAACRTAAEAAAATEALARRAEALRGRLTSAAPAMAEAWPAEIDGAFLDAVEASLDALETAIARENLAEDRRQTLDEQARAAHEAGDLDEEEDLIPRRRAARAECEAAKAAVLGAMQGLETLLQGTRMPPPKQDDTEDEALTEGTSKPSDGTTDPEMPAGTEPQPEQEINDPQPEETDAAKSGATASSETSSASDDGVPPSQAPQSGATTEPEDAHTPPSDDGPKAPQIPDGLSDAALLHWLHAGEIALAYHAARLAEQQGARAALPPAVLRGLALLRDIRRAEDMADPARTGAMAEMMGALDGAPPVAARVAFAALLRPALFDPDHGARAHLRSLSADEALAPYAAVIDALGALGHEVRLSVRRLAELGGRQVGPAAPQALEALRHWWTDAQKRKCMHQPTYRILHEDLHPSGHIGRIIQAVLAGAPNAEDEARSFIESLRDDRAAQEAFVEEAERRNGRPRRDRIEGMALTWFCERLQEACDHLSYWLEARAQDRATPGDSQRQRLLAALGPLRKAMQQRQAADPALSSGEPDLDAAITALVNRELDALDRLLSGEVSSGLLPAPEEALEGPLLRLPGGCQDWTGGDPALDKERDARDCRLTEALADPAALSPDWDAALSARRSEGAILAARAVLRRLEAAGLSESEATVRQQEIDEALTSSRQVALERVERLHQSFATLAYLDLDQTEANRGRLAQLAAIAEALRADPDGDHVALPAGNGLRDSLVPPDFPELQACLARLEDQRDQMRVAVVERQRQALIELCTRPDAGGARAILERLDQLDPVTVDDAIADLQAGRPVHLPEAEAPDLFEDFFPSFVRAVELGGANLGRGQIQTAMTNAQDLGPLALAALDSQTRKRGQQLVEHWSSAENALRQSQPDRLRDVLERLFGLIGLTGIEIKPGREAIQGRLRGLAMAADVPLVSDWFLPPAFGSESGGRFRLLAARDDVTTEQILREIGAEAPDDAWIVVQFRRLGEDDRRTLARRCRDDARRVLMLDETLLLFLASRSEDPLRAFFACTLPFAWVQPYVVGAGPIPREVFFGRQEEIRRIVAREAGGCLIYGGRQLGKSALLHHIRRERHRPDRGEVAIYLDIKPMGGLGNPAERIWDELHHALRREAGLSSDGSGHQPVLQAIRQWLDGGPDRRVLVMLDEADNFLRAEHGAGYPNLLPLKSLMEETGRRFKVVFAGLHNVRRMARAPNSPLPHLGDPICIGPMNQTEANRLALRRLALEPLRTAGLDFADPALAWDMLARMNHYPSLVQIFGHQVVHRLGRRLDRRSGPRWKLSREMLFEGSTAEAISVQIRDRFQLTLNLDLRYELFAKSIAHYRLDNAGGQDRVLSAGLTAAEIRDKALDFWPKGLAKPSLSDCEEILSEMVDLGVLAELAPRRFGLRNAQVAQMLGDRERLETELLQLADREDDPAYDAGSFHACLRPLRPKDRSPLSDRQLQQVFGPEGGRLTLIVAPDYIVGPEAGQRLLAAAALFDAPAELIGAEDAALRRALESEGVFIVSGAWSADRAQRVVNRLGERGARTRILWLVQADPAEMSDLPRVHARPWDENMLRLWLAEEGHAPTLDDRETRAAIIAATGGVPARLMALRSELADLAPLALNERQGRLGSWARSQPSIAEAAGLSEQDRAVLRFLVEDGAALEWAEELAEFCPEADQPRLTRLIAGGWLQVADRPGSVPRPTDLGRLAAA